jgi:serine/threonine protein kinase
LKNRRSRPRSSIHARGVSNILIDKGVIKLADFGISVRLDEMDDDNKAGTVPYLVRLLIVAPAQVMVTIVRFHDGVSSQASIQCVRSS